MDEVDGEHDLAAAADRLRRILAADPDHTFAADMRRQLRAYERACEGVDHCGPGCGGHGSTTAR